MKTIQWAFAKKHPILTFLLINFGWTWLFWLGAIPFSGQTLMVMAIVMVGAFGPAIGGILTLGLKNGMTFDLTGKKLSTFIIASLVIFSVQVLRYLAGNIPNFDILADDLTLTAPVILGAVAASLIGGWVFSSAFSKNSDIRARMASILPRNLPAGWTALSLLFYPAMILVAWGLAALAGLPVEYPGLWESPVLEVFPLYALTFLLTLLLLGGNEESGWRGFLQPEMQKRFSPLVAAIFVSLFWSLWHLPLFLNGFYAGDILMGMLGGGVYRILLAIFMAWFYNRCGGNVFLMIVLHTTFNMMVNYLPVSDVGLLVLWILVTAGIIVKDKMWLRISNGAQDK